METNVTTKQRFFSAALPVGACLTSVYFAAHAAESPSDLSFALYSAMAAGMFVTAIKVHEHLKWYPQNISTHAFETGLLTGLAVSGVSLLAYYLPVTGQAAPAFGWLSIAVGSLVAGYLAASENQPLPRKVVE